MTAEHIHDALTLLPADLIAETDRKRSRKPRAMVWKRYAAMAACFALVLCSGWFCLRLFASGGSSKESAAEAPMMQGKNFQADSALPETQAAAVCEEAAPMEAEAPAAMEETRCALPTTAAGEESAAEDLQTDIATANSTAGSVSVYAGMSQPKYLEAVSAPGTACFSSAPAPRLFQSRADLEAYESHTPQRYLLDNVMEACAGYDDAWFESHDLLLVTLCGVPSGEMCEVTAVYQQEGQWYICFENYLNSVEAERTDWHVLIEAEKSLIASEDDITLIFE